MKKKTPARIDISEVKKLADEAFERMLVARDRLGDSPESQLKWILDFAKKDLQKTRPEERVALGYDLRGLISGNWSWNTNVGPMPDPTLRRLHSEITEGLKGLFNQPQKEWNFPPPSIISVNRFNPLDAPDIRFITRYEGDERTAILSGVLGILQKAKENLRACKRCKTPFVRVRRQEYCSEKCSQKKRNEDKKSRQG